MHIHALFKPGREDALMILGQVKRVASRRVGRAEGRMFARAGGADRVVDRAHQANSFNYIVRHRDEGALVWDFRRPGEMA